MKMPDLGNGVLRWRIREPGTPGFPNGSYFRRNASFNAVPLSCPHLATYWNTRAGAERNLEHCADGSYVEGVLVDS